MTSRRNLNAVAEQPTCSTDEAARPRGRDHGFTLTEVMVAMALMATSVVAVIGGVRGVISASSTSDAQAKVESVLTSAADRLRAADYIPCPDVDGDYGHLSAAAASTVGWEADAVEITEIMFWDATAGGVLPSGASIDADGDWSISNSLSTPLGCQSDISLTTSRTLQKLTIVVTSPGGDVVREIEVVKSPLVALPADA